MTQLDKLNSKNRKYYILNDLLNGEHLSYQALSDEYLVSRSSIANDIAWIREFISQDNLQISFDNDGSYIDSEEVAKQSVIKRVILENKDCGIDKLFLHPSLEEDVMKIIHNVLDKKSYRISDLYFENITLILAIYISRSKKGFKVNDFHNPKIPRIELANYPICNSLLRELEASEIYTFSEEEIRYLTYILLANGFDLVLKENRIESNLKEKVEKLIYDIGDEYGVDIGNDSKLLNDLLIHISQLIKRSRTNTTIVNPILKEIKINYGKLFGIVWYCIKNSSLSNEIFISDDEVGFITIHFQAAIERMQDQKQIYFVCPHGIGTSSLALTRLQNFLPSSCSVSVLSLNELKGKNLDKVQMIVSTTKLSKLSVPVVNVSPIIRDEDITRVMATLMKVSKNRYIKEKTCLRDMDPNIDFSILYLEDKEELDQDSILNKILDQVDFSSEMRRKEYLNSINEREKMQS
ncbi:hypothetical protein FC52_GL001598 [Lactobacillus pasteurii DSM 23907 = CRBIP 24.76]|uniref:Transcriptional regulator ManR n=1 Tax=Lactobacillus pasteurii DSM 23907 = CRBIP 24.76 TaxID=1423790 RepID=I7LAI0_9LACO|nr:PRD domain-containing protein [Lactobacillus pasteurii]KRK07708.1 hypothetical protein FC52_GL001598 [Lactobacillus pasteurii DSM 23907 = CRBIP 24.76]TDG77717.1 hypothetical protein C5L33_000128 [Lactobacillus pasteurii]CCI84716.1 Transcriptional regulator ManR [Lactobacillus pasteurii DSM 23907 = CRBIP 24.76]